MDDEMSPEKKLTAGALLLHAIVLLIFATTAFINSMIQHMGFPSGLDFTPTAYFGAMAVMATWLSSRHYLRTVRKRHLKIWASFHITVSAYAIITYFQFYSIGLPFSPSILSFLLPLLLYIIPPVLVIVFTSKERT